MGRIVILLFVLLVVVTALFIGGSYLVVYWRDTTRRWRLEKEKDERKKIREANEEFIATSELLENIEKTKK